MKPTDTPNEVTPTLDLQTILPARSNAAEDILHYLQHHIPAYPFDPKVDRDFVDELLQDFERLDILEHIKAFRWYYDNQPVAKLSNVRLGLRRWLTKAWPQRQN